jgi:hypothetical protein
LSPAKNRAPVARKSQDYRIKGPSPIFVMAQHQGIKNGLQLGKNRVVICNPLNIQKIQGQNGPNYKNGALFRDFNGVWFFGGTPP